MPPKKANEAYFADVFNRPTTLAYCSADGYDIAPDYDYTAIMSKGINSSVSCTIDDVKGDIGAILTRLADLESKVEKKNARDDLRSALKTLNYTREL